MIVAVVGSGGKTTYIEEQAKAYVKQGKRVFVTTTTHMYATQDTLFTNDAAEICACLQTTGYCMAGQRADVEMTAMDPAAWSGKNKDSGGVKIRALSAEVLAEAAQCADVVLVEADGSKQKPVKYPAAHEPVIPAGTDKIVVVMGFFAAGHPIREVCHRPELVCACLGVDENHRLTEEDLEKLVEEGYLKPLKKRFPQAEIILKKSL